MDKNKFVETYINEMKKGGASEETIIDIMNLRIENEKLEVADLIIELRNLESKINYIRDRIKMKAENIDSMEQYLQEKYSNKEANNG